MPGQVVYIVCAEGEEQLAEQLAEPLRLAGYEVAHDGTVSIGESLIGTAATAVASGAPIVLCATRKSAGSTWSHQIVNAGRSNGTSRVFVVLMEQQAYVDHLALDGKAARFCDDPLRGVNDLIAALAKHFPAEVVLPAADSSPAPKDLQYLDHRTEAQVDHGALQRFRATMREEVAQRHPPALTPREFLERGELLLEGKLTRTGALLFGERPASACSTAMVKCVRYYGPTRAEQREGETFDGPVPDQIVAARDFVAHHVRRGERPSTEGAQAVPVYDYPMIAVREIIANALVHRDYSVDHSCVHVRLFSDRLEISSPGSWLDREMPTGVPLDLASLTGHSIKRNYRLAHVLSWVRLVEGEGSGIPTVLRECEGTSAPMPTVMQDQGFITVTLRPLPPHQLELGTVIGWNNLPAPKQLPMTARHFVGRQRELDELRAGFAAHPKAEAPAVMVITGMPGVGKTALAMRFAHEIADEFPDGQLYASLHSDIGPAEVLAGFLTSLGISAERIPADLTARAALYRSMLAGRRFLVVIDDVRHASQLDPLLPGTSDCAAVITSRSHLGDAVARWGASSLTLGELSVTEAVALFAESAGGDRAQREPEAAHRVAEMCGRLPLALTMAGSSARRRPALSLAVIAEMMDKQRSEPPMAKVRETFEWSYAALTEQTQLVFRALGVHPGPDVGIAALAAIAQVRPRAARAAVEELCEMSLLSEYQPGRFRVHDLVRQYARDLASDGEDDEQVRTLILRMIDYYLDACSSASTEWYAEEDAVLLAVIREAARAEANEQLVRLVTAVTPFFIAQQRWDDVLSIHAESGNAAARLSDHQKLARSLLYLTVAHCRRFEHSATLEELTSARRFAQRAYTLYGHAADPRGQCNALELSAVVMLGLARYEDALACYRQGLEIAERIGDRTAEATMLTGHGDALAASENPQLGPAAWNDALKRAIENLCSADAARRRGPGESPQRDAEPVPSSDVTFIDAMENSRTTAKAPDHLVGSTSGTTAAQTAHRHASHDLISPIWQRALDLQSRTSSSRAEAADAGDKIDDRDDLRSIADPSQDAVVAATTSATTREAKAAREPTRQVYVQAGRDIGKVRESTPTDHSSRTFAQEFHRLRNEHGLSLTRLSSLVPYSKGYLSKIEHGRVHPNPEMAKLLDNALQAGGHLIELADQFARPIPSDHATLLAFESMFHHHRTLGSRQSPELVLTSLRPQIDVLSSMARSADDPDLGRNLWLLAARYAEYAGWMEQERGDEAASAELTHRAVQYAATGDGHELEAYSLVRAAEFALYRGDTDATVALAHRASKSRWAGVQALAAQREALGYALAGTADPCLAALDRAAELQRNAPEPPYGTSSPADQVAISRAWSFHDLGRHTEAATILDTQVTLIDSTDLRARTRFGLRRTLAHAAAGDVDHACALVTDLLDNIRQVQSATAHTDLTVFSRLLSRQRPAAGREIADEINEILGGTSPQSSSAEVRRSAVPSRIEPTLAGPADLPTPPLGSRFWEPAGSSSAR